MYTLLVGGRVGNSIDGYIWNSPVWDNFCQYVRELPEWKSDMPVEELTEFALNKFHATAILDSESETEAYISFNNEAEY